MAVLLCRLAATKLVVPFWLCTGDVSRCFVLSFPVVSRWTYLVLLLIFYLINFYLINLFQIHFNFQNHTLLSSSIPLLRGQLLQTKTPIKLNSPTYSLKNIDFVINFSCANHIKYLKPYEKIGYNGQMSRFR